METEALKAIIQDIETANPSFSLTQQEALELIKDVIKPSARAFDLYRRFLSDDGIYKRHFAWDDPRTLLNESVDQKISRFEQWSVRLAVEACGKIFQKRLYQPADINAVFVCTCTGYLCPGLSTYVAQELGLSDSVYTLDLVGLGCAGALPALRAADHYLHRHAGSTVLVIAVEICSAAIHWGEKAELILSNSIFADGAAAVVVTNRPENSGLRIDRMSSLLWPQYRDELRFKYMDARLCNVISSRVPDLAAQAITALHKNVLPQKPHYAFHAAGRKVLDAIAQALNLSPEQMEISRQILKEYGNMSSPSVLFALKEILNKKDQRPAVCFSFGAGFTASILEVSH